jgi:four helix bundle protein
VRDYRNLTVWQRAHDLTLEIYKATRAFPSQERYGLVVQMRRCSVSVPSNIAEGAGRGWGPDYGRFLRIAAGSINELDYQLLLARDLGYVTPEQHQGLADEVVAIRRMLASLMSKVVKP